MIDSILSRYKQLKPREQILAIVFTVIIIATLYHRFLYRPFSGNVATYKFQNQKLKTRLEELRAELPEIDKQKAHLHSLILGNDKILNDIAETERQLPSKKDASRLTGELARLAEGLELVSVQQKIDEGEMYSRIFVELTLNAKYSEIVNYIDRIEQISPFLKIDEMEISEPKGKLKGNMRGPGITTRLLVSCLLLGETPVSEWFRRKEIEQAEKLEAPSVVRDIFVSRAKPVSPVRKTDLLLNGITYNPQSPTAIINDNVVRVDSEINGYKVKEIFPDAVILTDGVEDITLTIER